MTCPICQEPGELVTTDCQHSFHLECLKQLVKPVCPLCRKNLRENLLRLGITEEELHRQRHKKDHDDHLELMSEVMPEDDEFVLACKHTVKLDEDGTLGYQDLIFDQNANASRRFHQISQILTTVEPGVFVYQYENIEEFILQQLNPSSDSVVQWTPRSYFTGTQFEEMIENRISRRKDDEYIVFILFVDDVNQSITCNAHLVNKNAYKSDRGFRISQQDIISSLKYVMRCRCHGATPRAKNREFAWAQNYLKFIQQKSRKDLQKYVNKIIRNMKESDELDNDLDELDKDELEMLYELNNSEFDSDFDSEFNSDSDSDSEITFIPSGTTVYLPFYTPSAFRKVRNIMVDRDHYPSKYHKWLQIHQTTIERLQRSGIQVLAVDVKAHQLKTFCGEQKLLCDQAARSRFVQTMH